MITNGITMWSREERKNTSSSNGEVINTSSLGGEKTKHIGIETMMTFNRH